MSKYFPLWLFIKDKNLDKKELLDYGYEVKKNKMKEKTVLFEKTNKNEVMYERK